MKNFYLTATLAILGTLQAQARDYPYNWENAVTCDGGILAIDAIAGTQGGLAYQMVTRGNLTQYLVQNIGAAPSTLVNEKGEIILDQGLGYRMEVPTQASYVGTDGRKIEFALKIADPQSNQYKLEVVSYSSQWSSDSTQLGTYYFNNCTFAR